MRNLFINFCIITIFYDIFCSTHIILPKLPFINQNGPINPIEVVKSFIPKRVCILHCNDEQSASNADDRSYSNANHFGQPHLFYLPTTTNNENVYNSNTQQYNEQLGKDNEYSPNYPILTNPNPMYPAPPYYNHQFGQQQYTSESSSNIDNLPQQSNGQFNVHSIPQTYGPSTHNINMLQPPNFNMWSHGNHPQQFSGQYNSHPIQQTYGPPIHNVNIPQSTNTQQLPSEFVSNPPNFNMWHQGNHPQQFNGNYNVHPTPQSIPIATDNVNMPTSSNTEELPSQFDPYSQNSNKWNHENHAQHLNGQYNVHPTSQSSATLPLNVNTPTSTSTQQLPSQINPNTQNTNAWNHKHHPQKFNGQYNVHPNSKSSATSTNNANMPTSSNTQNSNMWNMHIDNQENVKETNLDSMPTQQPNNNNNPNNSILPSTLVITKDFMGTSKYVKDFIYPDSTQYIKEHNQENDTPPLIDIRRRRSIN